MKAGPENTGKNPGIGGCRTRKKLFSDDLLDLVTNKSTQDEDDKKEKYLNEEAGRSQGPEVDTHTPGDNILRSKHEDDPKDKADYDTIFEEGIIVLPALMEKSKGDTQDKVQNFKQHGNALS
jgi:hypothetical protein